MPASGVNIVIPSGTDYSPIISSSGAVANNVTVNSSAILTISSGGDFTVSGNLVNNGTVNVNGNLIVN